MKGENMSTGVNMGDVVFQLFSLAIPIIFIVILFSVWRASKQKKEQLNRIEEKLDRIQKGEK